MVPSSAVGVLLFVVLLAPGLAYVLRHERVVPARPHTAFREGLRVVFVSLACLLVTGLLAATLRSAFPRNTPNIRGLVQDPLGYWRGHHVQLTWWALAFILFATLLGWVSADRRLVELVDRLEGTKAVRWLTGAHVTDITATSAWYRVLKLEAKKHRPTEIQVGAAIDDGTYVQGWLWSFNVDADETQDREVVLSAPLHLTTQDGRVHPYGAQLAILSARHIIRLDVVFVKPETAAPVPPQRESEKPAEVPAAASPPAVAPVPTQQSRRRWWDRGGRRTPAP